MTLLISQWTISHIHQIVILIGSIDCDDHSDACEKYGRELDIRRTSVTDRELPSYIVSADGGDEHDDSYAQPDEKQSFVGHMGKNAAMFSGEVVQKFGDRFGF